MRPLKTISRLLLFEREECHLSPCECLRANHPFSTYSTAAPMKAQSIIVSQGYFSILYISETISVIPFLQPRSEASEAQIQTQ